MVRDTIGNWIRTVLLALAAVLALVAQPALAQRPQTSTACLAFPQSESELKALIRTETGWNCDRQTWSALQGKAVLRFAAINGKVPQRFSTRLSQVGSLRLGIVAKDRSIEWHRLDRDALLPSGHMTMAIALPQAGRPANAVLIELDRPSLSGALSGAMVSNAGGTAEAQRDEVYLAMLCGLLLAPLLFNVAFYRVLRERFLLWHAAVVGLMLVHVVVTSGLSRYIVPIPSDIISYLVALTYSAGTAAAIMLARAFIEPEILKERYRTALLLGATWVMLNCSILVASIEVFGLAAARFYFLGWVPVVAILVWVLSVTARAGSRAARYQVAAWAPLVVLGTVQILFNTLGLEEPRSLHNLVGLAIAWEVFLISLGIIDRLVNMRRDLDSHRRRANKLEKLVERDPLTGLMNRRAIEPNFARLRAEGFATFAVIDLDRFKDINDGFGHEVGDRVLQAAARALAPTEDMLSMRLGGEEFVLLLRGKNALRHAEWCRTALCQRIAAEVEGLDRVVTASMGLVEIPEDVMPEASFAAIYARADALLYQAKRAGRNRAVTERLTAFGKPKSRARNRTEAA